MPSTLIVVENASAPSDSRVWNECLSLRHAGWDVTVISPKGKGRDDTAVETLEGVQIHRFDMVESRGGVLGYCWEYGTALARIRRLVRKLSKETPFDVVHACNPPDFLLLTALDLRRRGAATVFDHHDLSPELYSAKYGRAAILHAALRMAERTGFLLADASLATNESFRDVAVQRGRKASDDVFVVRNGPDIDTLKPVAEDPSLKAGREHLVGYVGTMNDQDGIDVALAALRSLSQVRSDWHAIFVGDGDVLQASREAVVHLGLEACVTFTGFIKDRDRLAQIIATCDVCISPEPRNPLNEKSTLMKVAEYMAVGRAVVAFDLPETRRTAGDAALYALRDDPEAFAEAINDLLSDPTRRSALGAAGRERALKALGWKHSEAILLAAYAHAQARAASRTER